MSWLTSSNGKAPVLKIWGLSSNSSLPLLSDPFWPRVVVPISIPSMSQIDYSYFTEPYTKDKTSSETTIQKCKYECTMNAIP